MPYGLLLRNYAPEINKPGSRKRDYRVGEKNKTMAKTTLRVRVFGGVPPFSIKVILFKGSQAIEEFDEPTGFDHAFNKLTGNYSLLISGPNPLSTQRRTEISIDTSEITLGKDSDPNPAIRVGRAYMIQYFFKA